MKKINFVICLVSLVTLSLLSPAMAEGIRPGSFTLSGIIGGYTFDGRQHIETRPVYGVRGGYNFTKHWGVEGLFDYARTESTRADQDINFYRYGGEVLLHVFPDNKLVPYLAAGYVGLTRDPEGQHTVSKGAFDYGIGAKYFLTDDLALRADFRNMVFREGANVQRPGEYHDEGTGFNYEYTIGLAWQFGGKGPEPAVMAAPEPPLLQVVPTPPVQEEAPPAPVPAAEPTPGRYKYCISLNLQFDIDKALIRAEDHREIARVGEFMQRYPDTTAVIEGHTDNVGTDEHNLDLSRRRAESVTNYLVDKFGIDRSRLSSTGYGFKHPVADNGTEAGKQKNRRIDAIIDCAFDVTKISPPERLCMSLLMEFETGRAEIQPRYHDEIAKVAEYMKRYPTTTALIEGHTDNTGTADFNQKLSQERAENVVNYLVEKLGIERSRLSAKGYGASRRLAYNTTAEGRKKNRRINAIFDCVVEK
ncbi:peptidoglycan-binding outer membrane protein, OMP_b-brl, OmpA and OmpA domain-containing [Geotalea daltonii FRC-32]|uniref:Peptidoglycan-binding outer membrane protein, OMP_b-brl, OmpA and OmpA domain-containing n=1 Tax=Geotalea daltonii (strain DSM 22248 / JCM 15807 / FRC-32) TaxID=316067 RepID=B9M5Y9_GEODF|nr:OmpA family protein [Geotalea daltonii]ACM19970.1 peptidoglycan-binding outer membrane protein, OMP_b-brl, OmpA and OmpA domain-containing [Geotalea daltonii FRC-32]